MTKEDDTIQVKIQKIWKCRKKLGQNDHVGNIWLYLAKIKKELFSVIAFYLR